MRLESSRNPSVSSMWSASSNTTGLDWTELDWTVLDWTLPVPVGDFCDDALGVEQEPLRVEHVVRLVEHHHPHVLRVQRQRLAAHPVL
eukprot:3929452-Pyramimonas_sp.AAC.1